ncbi:KN motif and ankyrin repeat domain-containing protein 2-like isoform X1 [Anguilla rostrata]|uniref:KN motif and ankyrin repeat domain-containing protein 2-like isoform X1 n=1 Tax=Anguilla rostrata TaxID=7938 RepID=UPI0030CC54F7
MAQVLQMDSNFPGKSNPAPGPSFLGKENVPYSVETPYGYRLDLDFLKYVNDIEKGNTVRRAPAPRRPRFGSLPRGGYGYTGSWWTSTESLCSNASADSRQSSYSCCVPGYHGARPSAAGAAFGVSAARVEKTLLDARRRLEEEREREREGRKLSNLGSMRNSVAGSNTSLSSAHGLALSRAQGAGPGGGSSGLSTPVSPSPAHLHHVREQMALALRKIRELEEQVKTIPVLQVKISVLQEEKRQLSVQLKSHKFLGPSMGPGRPRPQRGELYIHIPEDEAPPPTSPGLTPASPAQTPASPAPTPASPTQTPTSPAPTPASPSLEKATKEVRSVGVGPEAEGRSREVGVGVEERDLGLLPEAEALRSRVGQLETTLLELQAAREREKEATPLRAEPAVRATTVGWRELLGGAPGLQSVLSFTQKPQRPEQRSVGVQVYTLEQPALMRAEKCRSPSAPPTGARLATPPHTPPIENGQVEAVRSTESASALPLTVCSRQVQGVLHRSEVSRSLPVSGPVVEKLNTVELKSSRGASQREGSPQTGGQSPTSRSQPAVPQRPLWPVLEHEAESQSVPLTAKQNRQLSSAPTGYESSSSEDSSSESSDEESDASEYHEARERLPETPTHRPSADQSAAKQGATQSLSTSSAPKPNANQLPLTASAPKRDVAGSPSVVSAPKQVVIQSPLKTQEQVSGKGSSGPCASQEARLQLSDSMMAALHSLQKAVGEPALFSQQEAKSAYSLVLQEWLRVSCHRSADTGVVRAYMDAFASVSPRLLEFVVNMADGNGNTALHYTVSHSNFPVVKQLLDTGLCNADKQNKAGYTAIMLTALAAFHSDSDLRTILQLLHSGDVNAKASQAGQTALMLAVSHGRGDMVRALLSCGAQVNVRDEDGSTALMCACEHGHVDIVRQLLSVPGCDATITDNDGSTALSIALEACQNDIAVLLYAHLNFAKPPSPVSPKAHQMGTSPPPAGDRKGCP